MNVKKTVHQYSEDALKPLRSEQEDQQEKMEQHQQQHPDVPEAAVPHAQSSDSRSASFSPTVLIKHPGFHPGLELPLVGTGTPVMAPQISEGYNKLPGATLAAGCSPWLFNQTVKVAVAVRGRQKHMSPTCCCFVPDSVYSSSTETGSRTRP